MANLSDKLARLSEIYKINPMEFDITVSALLFGIGAEKYVDIFRNRHIGQCTLSEMTDEDLIKLGVDDAAIRAELLEQVKNLPLYDVITQSRLNSTMTPIKISETIENGATHLYNIYLSVLANTLTLKKANKLPDYLLMKDTYASEVAIATVTQITNLLNSMDMTIHAQMKELTKKPTKKEKKKILVATVGSVGIIMLTTLFVRSLMELKKDTI
ncbi:hypothetical protein ACJJTC_009993 [Scirpophaga incertulas]